MVLTKYEFRLTPKQDKINLLAVEVVVSQLYSIFKFKDVNLQIDISDAEATIHIAIDAKAKKNATWRHDIINKIIFEHPDDFARIYFTVNGEDKGFGIFHKKIINPPQKARVPEVNKGVTAKLNGMSAQQYRNLNPYLNLDGSHNKYHSPPARQQHTLTDQPNKK